ncbi:MAG: ABC transporter substrate-binding protein [Anaerolineales bacterium]|nr:ABC transporter substrate-binding protein [Anaerolineales bacterium]
MKKTPIVISILIAILLGSLLSACGGSPTEPQSLRIAVLPILDALPMHVALERGYFAEHNLEVELVTVNSGPERDQLMQAGQVDGMINEIVSVLFYNQQEIDVVAVRFARAATADSAVFSIVAAPGSGIESVADLAGVEIGISEATVIDYMTDRVLQKAGLSPDEIKTVAIPRIPDRLALLQSGELAAATLPDPATSMALLQGATLIIDDSTLPEVGTSVITFSVEAVENKPEAIRGFLTAIEQAVADINAEPTGFNQMLAEKGLVPPPLLEGYSLPPYVTASVPSEALWQDAIAWASEKGLISTEPSYAESVDDSFLP